MSADNRILGRRAVWVDPSDPDAPRQAGTITYVHTRLDGAGAMAADIDITDPARLLLVDDSSIGDGFEDGERCRATFNWGAGPRRCIGHRAHAWTPGAEAHGDLWGRTWGPSSGVPAIATPPCVDLDCPEHGHLVPTATAHAAVDGERPFREQTAGEAGLTQGSDAARWTPDGGEQS